MTVLVAPPIYVDEFDCIRFTFPPTILKLLADTTRSLKINNDQSQLTINRVPRATFNNSLSVEKTMSGC